MTISSMNASTGAATAKTVTPLRSSAAGAAGDTSAAANTTAAGPATPAASPSTIVTLSTDGSADGDDEMIPGHTYHFSNGTVATVADPSTVTSIPLSVAWAPQLLAKGDQNGDNKLDFKEFSGIVKLGGMSSDDAQKLFDTFKKGKDGTVSVDDFVSGVQAAEKSGNPIFTKAIGSFLNDANGQMMDGAYQQFMAQGSALATQYWAAHR